MLRRLLIAGIVILFVCFLGWAWWKVTHHDRGLVPDISTAPGEDQSSISQLTSSTESRLESRYLSWCTQANVPLRVTFGSGDYGLLELLGVPRFLRRSDVPIGREPARDEWNVAVTRLTFSDGVRVDYLTESNGSWMHSNVSGDGQFVFATRNTTSPLHFSQQICSIFRRDRELTPLVGSNSLDRMPSVSRHATEMVFHSFRDENPGGDLYLAEMRPQISPVVTSLTRLTDSPEVEYVWPRISADANAIIAVERPVGGQQGRVILWRFENRQLSDARYLTDEPADVQFPSLDASGELACWQSLRDGRWTLTLWSEDTGVRALDISPSNTDSPADLVQPSLSPDGTFVVFVEDHAQPAGDLIGAHDIVNGLTLYFSGCDGAFMFPSISDPAPPDMVSF